MDPGNLSDLIAFVAAAEAESFVDAARARGMTRSGIAKSVARLEDRLGTRLFDRTTRSLALTAEGIAFRNRCILILADLEDAEQSLIKSSAQPAGLLRLTAPDILGRLCVLPAITEFMALWPRVRVEASFTNRIGDIIDDGYDLAIRIGGARDATRLISRVLAHQHDVVVGSPSYFAQRSAPVTPADLADHECLNFFSGGRSRHWAFGVDGDPVTIRAPGRLALDSGEALRDAALAGIGLAYLPSYFVDRDIAAGRLEAVLRSHAAAPVPIVALYPTRRYLAPKVRAFIDLLVLRLGDGVTPAR